MDNVKIGKLIYKLRKENNLTQMQLADKMNISDKTVSKWERGLGCPDLSLLPELSQIFNVDIEKLLSGEIKTPEILAGNMKKMHFYVCPSCGNMLTSLAEARISCCGKKLQPLELQKATDDEKLNVEIIENEYYISTDHPMERKHYIGFVSLLTNDTLFVKKTYPEWDLQVRIPRIGRGRLIWYCNKHGLYYMNI